MRREWVESSIVVAMDSSRPSEESEPLGVDFRGEVAFTPALVFRSARPEEIEDVVEEPLDAECGGCEIRAREERRGDVPAIVNLCWIEKS